MVAAFRPDREVWASRATLSRSAFSRAMREVMLSIIWPLKLEPSFFSPLSPRVDMSREEPSPDARRADAATAAAARGLGREGARAEAGAEARKLRSACRVWFVSFGMAVLAEERREVQLISNCQVSSAVSSHCRCEAVAEIASVTSKRSG